MRTLHEEANAKPRVTVLIENKLDMIRVVVQGLEKPRTGLCQSCAGTLPCQGTIQKGT